MYVRHDERRTLAFTVSDVLYYGITKSSYADRVIPAHNQIFLRASILIRQNKVHLNNRHVFLPRIIDKFFYNTQELRSPSVSSATFSR